MRLWLSALLLAAVAAPAACQTITNGLVTVRAVGRRGAYDGFDVLSKGHTVATVRFSSDGLLRSTTCATDARKSALEFTRFVPKGGTGLQLADTGRVAVRLRPQDPYPAVSFDLTVRSFDPARWQAAAGKQPFHFLALYLADAEAWHHRGWLNATPLANPFPLLQDTHVGTPEISAYRYNRTWSYMPPLSAHPLPVIGLWAPRSGRYVGLEFQTTRLADNSERDIATGYHWQGAADRPAAPRSTARSQADRRAGSAATQFVALVYPYGGEGYQSLVFPKAGARIKSHGVLLWTDNLPATDDPNRFFWSYLWERDRDRLPRVPAAVDMAWLPGGIRLQDFEAPPQGGLIGGVEGGFQVAGTRLIGGWRWQNEMPTQTAKARGDQAQLAALDRQAKELLGYAKRFRAGADECVFWEKPLEGQWTTEWGGKPATTLHNSNGFAAGRLFLGLYRDAGRAEYLPVVDGVLNWAKHVAWTRNEFADVPSSPFAIGGTLTASFCMDYWSTFRDAPDERHRNEARRALDLARSFTYRYLVMWPSDNDRFDNLDATFLWEPNSGRDWTGAACSNEVFWNLDTLAQAAVHTGDPALMWALQGSLSRWHLMYQERYKDSLADYQASDMTEGYGLAPGNVYGLGLRAPYGFASPLAMIEPVGESTVRVLAGEKAAMAFDKGASDTTISDYRYTAPGNLSFTVHSPRSGFALSLTVPYVDISARPVALVHDGRTTDLQPGRDFVRPPQAPWSILVRGVSGDDRVLVGEPDENGPVLPSAVPLSGSGNKPAAPPSSLFQPVRLTYDSAVDRDWGRVDTWPGAPQGTAWAYGVPYAISPGPRPSVVTKPADFAERVHSPGALWVLYSDGAGARPAIVFADGSRQAVDVQHEALAWRAWPPIFGARLLTAPVLPKEPEATAVGIDPGGRHVWAVTSTRAGLKLAPVQAEWDEVAAAVKQGAAAWQAAQREEKVIASIGGELAAVPQGAVALIPPSPAGPAVNLAMRAGLMKRAVTLTADQLVDPAAFTPARFPVAIYAGGEEYLHTVRAAGDAAEAVVRYVREGGTLLLLSIGPFPMYYATGPGFHRAEPLPARLGMPLTNAFETLPSEPLSVRLNPAQTALAGVPATMPFPAGDPRLRTVDRAQLPAGARYTPIYTVTGSSGKSYGDAAGLVERAGGGKVLYVWGGLMRASEAGLSVTAAALRYAAAQAVRR